jgi:hypothetical protein
MENQFGDGWEQSNNAMVLKQIDVNSYNAYGTNENHEIFRTVEANSQHPTGTGWEQYAGTLRHIAVG